MSILYTKTDKSQGSPYTTSMKEVVREFLRLYIQNFRVLLESIEGVPFIIKTNSYNSTYLNIARLIRRAVSRRVKKRGTAVSTQSDTISVAFNPHVQLIFQENPRQFSAKEYEYRRSFTYSLQSYELYAKKHFIILMRNLDYTKQYPNYRIIINFYKRKPIKDFSKELSKAFDHLKRWGVRGYYVFEPTPSRNWLHINLLTIYGRSLDDLKECIRYAFMYVGLTYRKDYHYSIKPIPATDKDYQRVCAYFLKFNGKRKTNRYSPVLFIKGLGLRKTGSFGNWFFKTMGNLWQEHREERREIRLRQALLDFNERMLSGKFNLFDEQKWQRLMDELLILYWQPKRLPILFDEMSEVFSQIDKEFTTEFQKDEFVFFGK